jgi:hypothetical protein
VLALKAVKLHQLAVDGFHFEIMKSRHVSPPVVDSKDTRTSTLSGHARTFKATRVCY